MALTDNPFAVLSFLAAPAILTNASTVLALGTSNRLARASDRARLLSTQLLETKRADAATALSLIDFRNAIVRARLLVRGLRCFYLAAGSFAAGTCVALLGAIASFFSVPAAVVVAETLALITAATGVGALVSGATILVVETRIALKALADAQAAIEVWEHRPPVHQPGTMPP